MALPKAKSLYDLLRELPEGVTGEILQGGLYAEPRPAGPHALAESSLMANLGPPFHFGRGGPGGWWILVEPEVHFVRDREVVVPDLAGWRRERMPKIPEDQRFLIVPDWVCEILSPGTRSKDREIKMPLYAKRGVSFLWLVDPDKRTLEAYELASGRWRLLGLFEETPEVRIPPFDAVSFQLADLWMV